LLYSADFFLLVFARKKETQARIMKGKRREHSERNEIKKVSHLEIMYTNSEGRATLGTQKTKFKFTLVPLFKNKRKMRKS
jgi:hypothetical protein